MEIDDFHMNTRHSLSSYRKWKLTEHPKIGGRIQNYNLLFFFTGWSKVRFLTLTGSLEDLGGGGTAPLKMQQEEAQWSNNLSELKFCVAMENIVSETIANSKGGDWLSG